MQVFIVFSLLILVVVLFSQGRLSVDKITLGMLIVLMATGVLTPTEAFAGFASDFIWMLAALFVLSAALQQTGVLDLAGFRLLRQARRRPGMLLSTLMSTVGVTSAFLNNTTVTAIYLAPVLSIARRLSISPSKLLMPVAYASILGGTCTLIGTSTNVAVNGYLMKCGYPGLGMFDILPIGGLMMFIGVVYMLTIGKRLLPNYPTENYADEFGLRQYVSEIRVFGTSSLVGQKAFHSLLQEKGFRVLTIIRHGKSFVPREDTVLQESDVMLVEGNINDLMKVKEEAGIEIRADAYIDGALQQDRLRLAEVLITPQSPLVNNTLQQSRFRHEYGLVVVAIKRHEHPIVEQLGKTPLRVGDILLVQGDQERIGYYRRSRELNILEDFRPTLYNKKKGILSVTVFLLAVLASITGWLTAPIAFLSASLVVVAARVVTLEKAYEVIDFRLLVLIAGMTAMGTAMTKTGAAAWITHEMLRVLEPFGLTAVMAGLVVLTVFLTQPLSNAAAALVVMPVAMEAALRLHVDPHPFAIAVMLSASVSLVTPFEPSCLLVYAPGRYRFMDFFRTGFLLTAVLMIVLVLMIPRYWSY